jgi:HD-GYP domain-containing protein (c-di-GMP phosphodiesterase class II)
MDKEIINFMSSTPLFYFLPAPIITQIAERVHLKHFPANTVVFREGEPGDSFYVIKSGHVQVIQLSKDSKEELIMAQLDPGDTFGEMALLIGQSRSATIKTSDEVELYQLKRDDFTYLMQYNPELLIQMNRLIDQRISLLDVTANQKEDTIFQEKFYATRRVEVDHIMLDLVFKLNMAAGGVEQVEHCKGTAILAQEMSKILCPMVSEEIVSGAYLHEIGKISFSKTLVEKERSGQTLTKEEEERVSMMWNCAIEILESHKLLQKQIGFIAFMGNEKFEEMPLEAQILKVADDYQQLINPHYRNIPPAEALKKIKQASGVLYNPKIVKALENILEKFKFILAERQKTYMRCINRALDIKDSYTLSHSQHTQQMCLKIGERMDLSRREMDMLSLSAELHDVGKIFIDQEILNAPRKHNDEEIEIMKKHPIWSANFFAEIPGMDYLVDIVRHHHEKIDGSGYPDGLRGENIPKLSRIMTVADVFSALTTPRVYRRDKQGNRKAFQLEEALKTMESMQPGHFDPDVISVFKNIMLMQKK